MLSKHRIEQIKKMEERIERLEKTLGMTQFRIDNPPKFKEGTKVFSEKKNKTYVIDSLWLISNIKTEGYDGWMYKCMENDKDYDFIREENLTLAKEE